MEKKSIAAQVSKEDYDYLRDKNINISGLVRTFITKEVKERKLKEACSNECKTQD